MSPLARELFLNIGPIEGPPMEMGILGEKVMMCIGWAGHPTYHRQRWCPSEGMAPRWPCASHLALPDGEALTLTQCLSSVTVFKD